MSAPVIEERAGGLRVFWCVGCDELHGLDARWVLTGADDCPTATPSLLLQSRQRTCHLFVREGRLEYLSDSTHALAGKTVPMEPLP